MRNLKYSVPLRLLSVGILNVSFTIVMLFYGLEVILRRKIMLFFSVVEKRE